MPAIEGNLQDGTRVKIIPVFESRRIKILVDEDDEPIETEAGKVIPESPKIMGYAVAVYPSPDNLMKGYTGIQRLVGFWPTKKAATENLQKTIEAENEKMNELLSQEEKAPKM